MKHSRIAFHASILIAASSAHAADRWWDGGTGDNPGSVNGASGGGTGTWNGTILNWDQGSGYIAWDNANYDAAIFGGTGGTVTLGAPITVNRLVFNTAGYVLTGTAANTLTMAGTSPTIVTNASASIGTNTTTNTTNTILAGANGLTITGAGGTGFGLYSTSAHTLSGGIIVKNGVNFAASTRNYSGGTNLLDPTNNLTFDGGHFSLTGSTGRAIDQTLGNATFNTLGSGTRLFVTPSSSTASTTTKLHLGTITGANLGSAGAGGLLTGLGAAPGSGSIHGITTTTAPTDAANNTYGKRVIYTADGGAANADWATATDLGGGVYQLAPFVAYNTLVEDGENDNLDMIASSNMTLLEDQKHGTLKVVGGVTLGLSDWVLELDRGGLILAGSTASTITSGIFPCLTAGEAGNYELVIHPYNSATAGVTISACIGDNPHGTLSDPSDDIPVSMTINNLNSNALTLSGLNNFTGTAIINGPSAFSDGKSSVIVAFNRNKDADPSTPEIEPNPSAFGTGTSVTLNGAVIQTGTTGSSDRDIVITGNSGFYAKTGTQTLAGTISGTGTLGIDGDFSTGTVVLSGANTFSGDIVLRPDSRLTLANVNALQNATLDMSALRPVVAFSTATSFTIGGLKGYNPINLGTAAVSIGNNNQSNDYWAVLSGTTGSLTKIGTGIQTIRSANTYAGNTTVNSGVLKLDSIPQQTNVAVTVTGTSSNLNRFLTVPSSVDMYVGQAISGPNIPLGTTIVEVAVGQVKMSAAATAAGATTASFAGGSGGMPNSPVIEVQSGATLDASALPSAFAVGAAQTLGGTGTVSGPISVSGDVSPGAGAANLSTTTGTLTTGNVAFTAAGEYVCTVVGANCDVLAAGNLTVAAGAKLSFSGTPTEASYVIATYTGAEPTHFDESSLPSGYVLDYTEAGKIKLVEDAGGSTPFESWASAPPYNLSGADALPDADPDKDGVKNIVEFALGGNPTNGSANGASLAKVQDVAGSPALTLTILTRSGTSFGVGTTGPRTAIKDGVTYTIQGSQNLSAWNGDISEVTPAITAGMASAPAGYEYHTFKAAGPFASTAKDFIRVGVTGQ